MNATALLSAAASGDLTRVEDLLNQGVDVDAVDATGRSSLILAAAHGHRAVVDRLLAAGASVLLPDRKGVTATDSAAESGRPDIVHRLLQAGGELDLTVIEENGDLSFVQERSQTHPRGSTSGVETFDFHSTLVLTEGYAADVAQALKRGRRLNHMYVGAYGEARTIGEEAYLALRLAGQSWSILMPINGYLQRPAGEILAKFFSQRLATRAVYFETDDTKGRFFYHLFGSGLSLEWLANEIDAEEDSTDYRGLTEGKSDPHPEAFYSKIRKLDPDALLNPEAFTNDFFVNLGLRVPAFGPGTAEKGETIQLSMPGYSKEDLAEFILLT